MKSVKGRCIAVAAVIVFVSAPVFAATDSDRRGNLLLSDAEIAKVVRHGPWPLEQRNDPSNRVSGNPAAIEFGQLLFFDKRLSANGKIACSTCHDPEFGWTDQRKRAGGLARLDRNTQSLFNVFANRWFGWDGRNDSLWAHSIGPILDPREMGATSQSVADTLRNDPDLSAHYQQAFGTPVESRDHLNLLVDAAKAIAAFQETITSGRTPFDEFRDALARKDYETAQIYPPSAQRGAALFVGRGRCNVCHIGARFTNEEFDDAGIPYFIGPGRVDSGRFGGIQKLRDSKFNQLGRYSDAPDRAPGWAAAQVSQTHRTFGQFKVPSLRQLTQTAPYMHNGSLETLRDVVDHYSNIDLDRIHGDGALILQPLKLSEQESRDLVAFLRSLSTHPGSKQ